MKKRVKLLSFLVVSLMVISLVASFDFAHATTYYGNQYAITNLGTIVLSNSAYMIDYRFTAEYSLTITKIYVYCTILSPPVYTIGIQADVLGNPSGTYLSSTTFTPAANWTTITISSLVIVSGVIYHLVIQYSSGTIGSSNKASFYYTTPLQSIRSFDNSADSNANTLYSVNSGVVWTVENINPCFIISGGSTYDGEAYYSSLAKNIKGIYKYGEEFTPISNTIVSTIDFYVEMTGGTAEDSLYVSIYDTTTSAYLINSEVFASNSQIGSSSAWFSHTLSSPQTLTSSHVYKVWLSSPSTTGSNGVYYVSGCNAYGNPLAAVISWNGTTNEILSGTVTPPTTLTPQDDISFRFTVQTSIPVACSYSFTLAKSVTVNSHHFASLSKAFTKTFSVATLSHHFASLSKGFTKFFIGNILSMHFTFLTMTFTRALLNRFLSSVTVTSHHFASLSKAFTKTLSTIVNFPYFVSLSKSFNLIAVSFATLINVTITGISGYTIMMIFNIVYPYVLVGFVIFIIGFSAYMKKRKSKKSQ